MKSVVRGIKASAYLGWQVEANWVWAPLYLFYAIIRPFALAVLLFFLFKAVVKDPSAETRFFEVYVANGFFTIISTIAHGLSWAVIMDREEYRTLGYVHTSPLGIKSYLIGRSLPFVLVGLASMLAILLFGWLVFGLDIFGDVSWVGFACSVVAGVVVGVALAILFVSTILITARHGLLLAEGISGVLLLFSGVVFPLEMLPSGIREAGLMLPTTYFIEFAKRAFGPTSMSPVLSGIPDVELWARLAVSVILWGALAYLSLVGFLKLAVRYGKLDQPTHY